MAVEFNLPGRAGDDGDVEAVVETLADGVLEQRDEHRGLAELGDHGEQPAFDRLASRGQVGVEIRHLGVEGERPLVAQGHHGYELPALERDDVGVLGVEPIDQPSLRILCVLRDLLDEGPVVELVDLLELPGFRGNFYP